MPTVILLRKTYQLSEDMYTISFVPRPSLYVASNQALPLHA